MFWRIVSYPALILTAIAVTTLFEFTILPLASFLRRYKGIVPAVIFTKDTIAGIAAVFAMVTLAVNTRLNVSVAIVAIAYSLHASNTLKRLNAAEAGVSNPALTARARGEDYDNATEIRSEWSSLVGHAVGFGLGSVLWWPVLRTFW